jgi:hypothetical protein
MTKKMSMTVLFLFMLSSILYAEEVTICQEHGRLKDEEIATIVFMGEEYQLCQICVMRFIENNMEEFGRLLKAIKEETK